MQQFGGKDSKRHFTVVMGGKEYGLYVSSTPSSAARKAVTKLCAGNKSKKVEFSIREITQGSKKKTYGPYKGHIEKLKEQIELKGRVIKYKPVAKLSAKKGVQKGGFKNYITEYFYIVFKGKSNELELLIDSDINQLLKDIKGKIEISRKGRPIEEIEVKISEENSEENFEENFKEILSIAIQELKKIFILKKNTESIKIFLRTCFEENGIEKNEETEILSIEKLVNNKNEIIVDPIFRKSAPITRKAIKFIKEHTDGSTVLEIGCGSGIYAKVLRDYGVKVIATDACRINKEGLPDVKDRMGYFTNQKAINDIICKNAVTAVEHHGQNSNLSLFLSFPLPHDYYSKNEISYDESALRNFRGNKFFLIALYQNRLNKIKEYSNSRRNNATGSHGLHRYLATEWDLKDKLLLSYVGFLNSFIYLIYFERKKK